MNTVKIQNGNTKMIAHRGVSGLELENTCAAFIAAGNRSYFGIETDVHQTGDGKFIIIHDDTTARVSGTDLTVEETAFETLRQLQLSDPFGTPRKDLCLPSLDEYLSICKKYEKIAVLELKNPMSPDTVRGVLDIVAAHEYLAGTLFISFYPENLISLREMQPDQPIQFLADRIPDPQALAAFLKQHRFHLDAYYQAVTPEIVRLMHENQIEVNVWTVDDPQDAEKLISMGVDYITSNILE